MNMHVRSMLTGFASALCATAAWSGDFYTTGPGFIEGISDNGVACGSFNSPEYFVWTVDGGAQLIGGTVAGNGIGGQAKISNDGTRICGTFDPGTNVKEMGYYDIVAAMWVGLGGIGDPCPAGDTAELSSGWNISGNGDHVVGLGWLTCADAHAMISSTGGGPVDLGSTVAGQSSRANGVNDDGTVVVGWQDGNGRQGAVWVNGVQELIPNNNGESEAMDVSGDGQWVTGIAFGGIFGPPAQTYRYNTVTNVHEPIANLAVGGESRMAGTAITDDGSIIVGGTWPLGPATFGTAIIWQEGVGTMRMDDYLTSQGIDYPAGYNFAFASCMSSDGKWIAGWGSPSGVGASESWVVSLGSDCPTDLDGDGMTNAADLAILLGAWGPNPGSPADLNGDGTVNAADLAILLGGWGACV